MEISTCGIHGEVPVINGNCGYCEVSQLKEQVTVAVEALARLTIGTCQCGVKSPELGYHKDYCRYRIAAQALKQIAQAKGG